MTEETTQNPVPAFDAAFETARKAYALASATFLAWALIGIDITVDPIENFHLKFKSPDGVPWGLSILVLYCGTRFTIEWYQADPGRRRLPASRADFRLAHAIGALSLIVYAFQTLSHVQLANAIPQSMLIGFMFGAALGPMGYIGILDWQKYSNGRKSKAQMLTNVIVVGLVLTAVIWRIAASSVDAQSIATGLVTGLALVWGCLMFVHRRAVETES
jgi:hypothetical protein